MFWVWMEPCRRSTDGRAAPGLGPTPYSSISLSSTAFADTAAVHSTASCSATFSLAIDASSMIGSYTERRFTVPVRGPLQLTGEGGLLRQLTTRLLESAFEGEMTDHLGYDKH